MNFLSRWRFFTGLPVLDYSDTCFREELRRSDPINQAPLVALPALAVPPTPTDAALEFEEEEDEEVEEEELEMFDESIGRFEHSSFRPRRLCRHYMAGRCEEGWSCTFAHGEQELC